MGQKINSNLIRVGSFNNEWALKYIEKNTEDFAFLIYKGITIKNFIYRFFIINGLLLHTCKIFYDNFVLKIFISYFITLKSSKIIKKITKSQKIKYKKTSRKHYIPFKVLQKKQLDSILRKKNNFQKKKWAKKKIFFLNCFSKKLIESLKLFTNNHCNLFIIFQILNKSLSLRIKNKYASVLKNFLFQSRRFVKFDFYKETINILLIVVLKKKSSKILTDFLAFRLSVIKNLGIFLTLFKYCLKVFLKTKFSGIKGIKIKIKGRLNGVPRTRTRTIILGKIPLQTYKSICSHSEATSFTKDGTFGIKVWLFENSI